MSSKKEQNVDKNQQNVAENVLNRLKNELKIKSDKELANYLGVNYKTLGMWKIRNSVQHDIIITKCGDLDLNWVFAGNRKKTTDDMFKKQHESSEKTAKKLSLSEDFDLTAYKEKILEESIKEAKAEYSDVFDYNKFMKLVWYLVRRTDERLGLVKLHKILYYTDRKLKLVHKKTFAREKYIKEKYGPVSVHLPTALKDLEIYENLKRKKKKIGDYEQEVFSIPSMPPLQSFKTEEITIVEQAIDYILPKTAKEISDVSHDALWESTPEGEEIVF